MTNSAVPILLQHLANHLARLAVLREYRDRIDQPNVKLAISFVVEDTQESIARVSSRLRQLGYLPEQKTLDETIDELLHQSRSCRYLEDKLIFLWRGLKYQQEWYARQLKSLKNDADSQAILVALAEQNRVRLERWENLLQDMKVTAD